MNDVWRFFERRVCLTTVDEEWQQAVVEFDRVGLTVQKFQSIPDIVPHQSFCRSIKQILTEFNDSSANTLLHLEDDCIFRDLTHLGEAIESLPPMWDILYLGANLLLWNNGSEPPVQPIAEHLFRIRAAWTTHAVCFNKKVVPYLLENQPEEQMFDNWLGLQLKRLYAYIPAPMVAYQRPHYSSIWGRWDDYGPIFEASNKKLVVV